MNSLISRLYELKHLSDIDIMFAKNIAEVFSAEEAELFFALVFHAVSSGHTCLVTDKPQMLPFYEEFQQEISYYLSEAYIDSLSSSGLLSDPHIHKSPFIRKGRRVYLRSFYNHEKNVSDYITSASSERYYYKTEKLKELLTHFFGTEPDMQKAAAVIACINRFSVISGGPGTGKTTTVFKVLAMLEKLSERPLNIAVCAPTGKAASRLSESIRASLKSFKSKTDIPEKAVTLHRLLKLNGSSDNSRFNPDNPMPYDVVVTDEASMIDLRMMSVLTQALKPGCRLILLGDKDQLSSVQPGNILGDICSACPTDIFTQETAELVNTCADIHLSTLKESSSFYDITIQLTKSRRFDDSKGIGQLAKACRESDADKVMDILKTDETGLIKFLHPDVMKSTLTDLAENHFRNLSEVESPENALKTAGDFIILSPLSAGSTGAESINNMILLHLYRRGLRDNTKRFFHGLPVMITENDYNLGLYNGTTGIIFKQESMKAFFEEDSKLRSVSVSRLPAWAPVFAMTVHKSQGSEYKHVVLVLPEESQVMTSELFYTAVTRAMENLTVIATEQAVRNCLSKKSERFSGLFS